MNKKKNILLIVDFVLMLVFVVLEIGRASCRERV